MEVGAVKQAFNNEVIQLKKNFNQARIQIIHKLTRKAKTFVEKKAPEKLKEKLKRKAESAVNEVLILKKLKPRDVARFTVTHTGNLQDYLNKPIVDQDKACARLLLHKSLQEKYKTIRNTFCDIPIKDLLMSRNERLKLKREARLDQKMKKDKKKKVVNAVGEWNVESINTVKTKDVKKNTSKHFAQNETEDDEEMEFDEQADSDEEEANTKFKQANQDIEKAESDGNSENGDGNESDAESEAKMKSDQESNDNEKEGENSNNEESDIQGQSDNHEQSDSGEESDNQDDSEIEDNKVKSNKEGNRNKSIKSSPAKVATEIKDTNQIKNISPAITFDQLGKNRTKPDIKNPNKSKDMHKNKNLKEKLQTRKFKKASNESQVKETKIVDPFFITATGENYMSVAEPRQPDEFKEIHKQGNRKERRAVMFGHVPRVKPRQDFRENNSRQNNSSGRHKNQSDDGNYRGNDGYRNVNDSRFRGKSDQFRNQNDTQFEGRNNQFKGNKPFEGRNQFKGKNDGQNHGRNDQFKGRNDSKFKGNNNDMGEPKVEKLHPSWEAKKKQSGILPFQGKKIVFDEG